MVLPPKRRRNGARRRPDVGQDSDEAVGVTLAQAPLRSRAPRRRVPRGLGAAADESTPGHALVSPVSGHATAPRPAPIITDPVSWTPNAGTERPGEESM